MMTEIATERVPIKLWLPVESIDSAALEQAKNLANHPFVFHHVAVMPDAHTGFGMPIGGVAATEGVVIPNAVGVDIGCGMCAVPTSLGEIDRERLKKVLEGVRKSIPLGFKHHPRKRDRDLLPDPGRYTEIPAAGKSSLSVVTREYEDARTQIGTLGGGNHFIEIQKGSDSRIWIMVHSGSRNLGKQVADHYNRTAKVKADYYGSGVPPRWDLAYLPLDSPEGEAYLAEMRYCVDFALANRKEMMRRIMEIFADLVTSGKGGGDSGIRFGEMINIAHNYAAAEFHFGKEVIVHRKGAVRADEGVIGIIPGSQGTSSYIVRGKGNPESFLSSSHGAGRTMGRREARRKLDLAGERKDLESRGILHSMYHQSDLEEAASAYKDIRQVMDYQSDLTEIMVELTPLGVVKG